MSVSKPSFKIALIQSNVTSDKIKNVEHAVELISTAKASFAELVVLPEIFNSPYGVQHFSKYAEEIPNGETCKYLSKCARENNIFIVGGSIPESEGSRLYNTSTVWNPQGELIAKHRKIHLFDIDIPGKITFKESDALSPGNDITIFEVNKCKIGLGICYDMRFPELANIYRDKGCKLIIYPGAFNMTTGPMHWKLLLQARACDNQLYVAGVSPARDTKSGYVTWGHTMLVNPLGQVENETEDQETIVYGTLDMSKIDETRRNIPILQQRRTDIYNVIYTSK